MHHDSYLTGRRDGLPAVRGTGRQRRPQWPPAPGERSV